MSQSTFKGPILSSNVAELQRSEEYRQRRAELNDALHVLTSSHLGGCGFELRQDTCGFLVTFRPDGRTTAQMDAGLETCAEQLRAMPQIASVNQTLHANWQLRINVKIGDRARRSAFPWLLALVSMAFTVWAIVTAYFHARTWLARPG